MDRHVERRMHKTVKKISGLFERFHSGHRFSKGQSLSKRAFGLRIDQIRLPQIFLALEEAGLINDLREALFYL